MNYSINFLINLVKDQSNLIWENDENLLINLLNKISDSTTSFKLQVGL